MRFSTDRRRSGMIFLATATAVGLLTSVAAVDGYASTQGLAEAGAIDLVSVEAMGSQPIRNSRLPAAQPASSAHGRFVVFQVNDADFVEPDDNAVEDVYLRDGTANTTSLISVADGQARGGSGATISADGRYVAFLSSSSALTPDDSNGEHFDVFVRDTQTGELRLISTATDGTQRNVDSQSAVIAGDGRSVAFLTAAKLSRLDDDPAGVEEFKRLDVYVKNLASGRTRLVSVDQSGSDFTAPVGLGGISYDGQRIGFTWGKLRHQRDPPAGVYVRDLAAKGSRLIWRENLGSLGATYGAPAISGNGRFAAFASDSGALDPDPNFAVFDVARYDLRTNELFVVSTGVNGADAHGDSFAPSLSRTGQYVGFASEAENLVSVDGNDATDAFRLDIDTQSMTMVSSGSEGPGDFTSAFGGGVAITSDGQHVAFHSYADNLAPGDVNHSGDVFLWTSIPG